MEEETKKLIKQFKEYTNDILKYQNENKVECYEHMKTHEIVPKDHSIEYVFEKLGIHITPKSEVMQEQYDFIKDTRDWYFSGNWLEVLKKESDL